MEIIDLIESNFMQIIPVLWFIGYFIKNTEKIKDEYIPFVLTAASILLCATLESAINAEIVIQGVLCAGTAVMGNQYMKQFERLGSDDSEDKL